MRALKKKPVQIYIESKHELLLESLADRKGISKAEIIRLSIDKYLHDLPVDEDPAFGIVGLGRSGKSGKGNISEKHDIYLARHISSHAQKKQ
jgi:hypothetical protein